MKNKEEDAANQDQEEEEWIRFATETRDTEAERWLESVMQMERYLHSQASHQNETK